VPIVILTVLVAILVVMLAFCGAFAFALHSKSKTERDARVFPRPPLHTTTRNDASFATCMSHLPGGETFRSCESTVTGALDLDNLDGRLAALRA
jgi:hypothetical protein